MRGDLLRTFTPHFMAGLADYQIQVNEDAQRESFTLVEGSGGKSFSFHNLAVESRLYYMLLDLGNSRVHEQYLA